MSSAEEIKKRIRKLEEIPTLPEFFNKIMETIESERTSVKDLAKIIGQDPALTSKIFKLSNSAYYGRFKKVSTVEQAVTTVGFKEIKTISLSIAVFGSFSDKIGVQNLQKFWIHAMTTAAAIQTIGERNQESALEKIYFGGLLHDIGKLVFTLLFGEEYFKNIAEQGDVPELEAEKSIYGVNHTQVGKWLSDRWHFPSELNELITYHHHPARSTLLRPRSVATVYVGDYVSHHTELEELGEVPANLQHSMDVLDLTNDELLGICQQVNEQQETIRETFSLIS
jgi:HD-like signal output (HDOD) protein